MEVKWKVEVKWKWKVEVEGGSKVEVKQKWKAEVGDEEERMKRNMINRKQQTQNRERYRREYQRENDRMQNEPDERQRMQMPQMCGWVRMALPYKIKIRNRIDRE